MRSLSMGDLVQTHLFRSQNGRLQNETNRLLEELTSGQSSDKGDRLGGDYTALARIERSLGMQSAYGRALDHVDQLAEGQQIALDTVSSLLEGKGPEFIGAAGHGNATQLSSLVADGVTGFRAVVGALNTRIGDRAIFAGTATQGPALADADAILAELTVATAAATTAAGVMTALDAWFGDGGGFESTGYLGSDTPLSPVAIGEGVSAQIDVSAADPALRETLKGFALAALLDQGLLSGSDDERLALLDRAGRIMVGSQDAITAVQAGLGRMQARSETARASLGAEEAGLKLAREALIGVDEYEAATRLEEARSQLEMLYTATARLSDLSFANFL